MEELDFAVGTDPTDQVVLIVEDDEELAAVYARFLGEGYAVRAVHTGEDALEAMNDTVDIVLLDRRLPDIHGDRVLRRLRAAGFGQPVAMLTAVTPGEKLLDLPVDQYVTKPIDRDTLRETVDLLTQRATFEAKSREFFRLLSKRQALTDPPGDLAESTTEKRGERLSELRSELSRTMEGMLTETFPDSIDPKPDQADVETLLSEIVEHDLPPAVNTLVDEYQSIQDARPPFMWKWVHHLAPQNTLPVVADRFRDRVPIDKTLTILFVTLLDDRLEKRGDRTTFAELAKIPELGQGADPDRDGVNGEYVRFTQKVWETLIERIEDAPRYAEYLDLFRFDVKRAIMAIEYSDLTIRDPSLATMDDLERIESHNMVMFAYADIDLMHAEADHRSDLADIREIVWIAQQMARIGNWVSTWERELAEGDWSAGPLVHALNGGVVTQTELREAATDDHTRETVTERVREAGIEDEFLARWERRYYELQRRAEQSPLDFEGYIDGTQEVLRYHLASTGLK